MKQLCSCSHLHYSSTRHTSLSHFSKKKKMYIFSLKMDQKKKQSKKNTDCYFRPECNKDFFFHLSSPHLGHIIWVNTESHTHTFRLTHSLSTLLDCELLDADPSVCVYPTVFGCCGEHPEQKCEETHTHSLRQQVCTIYAKLYVRDRQWLRHTVKERVSH